jgi:restriction endonuclease
MVIYDGPMISEDEYLERVVAGIQAATHDAADVQWNEIINGRQFDVVVRFTLASLRYLVLFEVKNRKRKASAEDLDAFVTKSRDQNANKAVFVNVAGFQSGSKTVAKKHGIELFTVHFDRNRADLSPSLSGVVFKNHEAPIEPPNLSISEPQPVLQLVNVKLIFVNGKSYKMPNESTQVNYYMNKTVFHDGSPLGTAMDPFGYAKIEEGEELIDSVKFDPPRMIVPPDDYYFPAGDLKEIQCRIKLIEAKMLSGNILIDPSAFGNPVIYKNALTEEELEFTLDQLPLGGESVEPGSFYMQIHPLMYYHCDKVEGDLVTWSMIESFQNGQMSRATFIQKTKYAVHFIPVRDKVTVSRLKRRLVDYRSLQSVN